MSHRHLLAWFLVALAAAPAAGQAPFPADLVPTRSALARLGLERQWMGVVPLAGEERLVNFSMSGGLIFAQTNRGYFHTYNAETGQPLWSTRLGTQTARARPASVNSFAVFVTNLNTLFAIDRRTGRTIWSTDLGTLPSSSTACDENQVMVGLGNGRMVAYNLKVRENDKDRIAASPVEAWNWQTGAIVETRPLPAGKLVAFGSDDGRLYVTLSDERTILYRIATGGPIARGLGSFGTRLLLVPSADQNLYGVDLLTAKILWTFASGSPISQAPLVGGNDIFIINDGGLLSSIDAATGSPHWTVSTLGGRLLTIGAKRVYLESHDEDLFIIDRASGQTIAAPRDTLYRVGLNLRPFEYGLTNIINDRLYFATTSGLIVALRELGEVNPMPLRNPKEQAFGTIPPEGVSLVPPPAPTPTPTEPAEPGAETPPASDNPAPAGGAQP